MKFFIAIFSLFLLSCSNGKNKTVSKEPLTIDSIWQKKTISDVLTISFPDSVTFNKNGVLNASFAEDKSGLYGIDYYDTVIVPVTSELDFRSAVKGYMYGKLKDPQLSNYDLLIRDTAIAGTSGLFMTGYSTDSLQSCKYPFCYLTMADNKFYWFYACQSTPDINKATRQFFYSIQFATNKIKESAYGLSPEKTHKKAD